MITTLSKSQNKYSCLYTKAIEAGTINSRDDVTDARKVCRFGPNTTSCPNLLINVTKDVQCLDEIKNSCIAMSL